MTAVAERLHLELQTPEAGSCPAPSWREPGETLPIDGSLENLQQAQFDEIPLAGAITITMRYSHLAPDHLRAAVAALDGVLSSSESEPTKVSAQGSAQEHVAVGGVSAN